jgi:hypothetical protein
MKYALGSINQKIFQFIINHKNSNNAKQSANIYVVSYVALTIMLGWVAAFIWPHRYSHHSRY